MPSNKKISLPVQKPFPILKFPPEIRNHIWRILVVVDDVLKFRNYDHHAKIPESRLRSRKPTIFHQEDDERRLSSQLAVAFTCRQFYLEVTPIYYGENTFSPGFSRFRPMDPQFENFTDAIGPKNASNITRLQLDDWRIIFDAYFTLLPGLKCLYFTSSGDLRWTGKMTSLAQKHTALKVVYDGEVWGPEKWKAYPGYYWRITSVVPDRGGFGFPLNCQL